MATTFIIYLLKSGFCIAALWLFFKLFLAETTFFKFNRILLLAIPAVSMLIPLIPIENIPSITTTTRIWTLAEIQISSLSVVNDGILSSGSEIILVLLAIGSLIYAFLLIHGVLKISDLARKGKTTEPNIIHLRDRDATPFSFFKWIFIPENMKENPEREHIIQHELIHARQWHSLDTLYFQLIKLFQWWNPLFWQLEKSLKDVHEFQVDQKVISAGTQQVAYKHTILKQATGIDFALLGHSFNSTKTKRRILMIEKKASSKLAMLKYFLIIPIAAGLISLSASPLLENFNSNKVEDLEQAGEPDSKPEYPGGMEALGNFFNDNIKYPEAAKSKAIIGKVVVAFTINKKGKVVNAKVESGIGHGCDQEAIRVVKMMNGWKPGMKSGKTVSVEMRIPVVFEK